MLLQLAHSPHVKRSDTQTKTNKGFRPAVVKAKAVYCFAKNGSVKISKDICLENKNRRIKSVCFVLLSRQDSNLKCLNQNQMCYHYTTGQSHRGNRKLIAFSIISIPLFASAKVLCFFVLTKFFENFSAKMLFFVPFELFLQGERCSRS